MKMKRILILTAIITMATGCFQGKKPESGPTETLKIFYEKLCAGDFTEAGRLCDSLSMGGYIEGFRNKWQTVDSSVIVIASDILSAMDVDVTDMEKNGKDATIFYKLTATDGQSAEKVATLRKEEGEWKIETITDKH